MLEMDDGDYEVKDEELVDFEGSDYGFESDEDLDLEEDVSLTTPMQEEGGNVELSVEKENIDARRGEQRPIPEAAPVSVAAIIADSREGAESGEIEEDREEKEDGVVAKPVPSLSSLTYRGGHHREGRVGESRRRHRKADLEDGELDDAAMPEGSDHEAEGIADDDDEDNKDRRERKRRKDRFAAERRSVDLDKKERESGAAMAGAPRQHRSRGSDRQMERSGGLSKAGSAGGRVMMPMGGFGHPANMAPGIMGPGRSLVPLDMGPAISLRPLGRGFMGSLGGMPLPGAVGMSQFQEAMAVHEHMIHHRMMQQFAQVNAAVGPGRPSMVGPLGAPSMRSMMGLEFANSLPRSMMHMQPQGPDIPAQPNFVGPMDNNYPRSSRSGYATREVASAGGMFGQVASRMGSSLRNGMGRQGPWPPMPVETRDVHSVGRGRGEGRGHLGPPVWADPHGMSMTQAAAAQAVVVQGVGMRHNVNMGHTVGQGMMGAGPGVSEISQGPHSVTEQGNQAQREGMSNDKRVERDRVLRVDGDQSTRNGAVQNVRASSNNWSTSGTRSKHGRENGRDKSSSLNSGNLNAANISARGNSANGGLASASNLIQLGAPVQKSRSLTVSGLLENTSMSVVVEAFEKQGKVTDFRKEERGDAFTITFASVPEAISAKRHMHRSKIAGRQITVEYAVQ